jgi:hypothetical protein
VPVPKRGELSLRICAGENMVLPTHAFSRNAQMRKFQCQQDPKCPKSSVAHSTLATRHSPLDLWRLALEPINIQEGELRKPVVSCCSCHRNLEFTLSTARFVFLRSRIHHPLLSFCLEVPFWEPCPNIVMRNGM